MQEVTYKAINSDAYTHSLKKKTLERFYKTTDKIPALHNKTDDNSAKHFYNAFEK